MKVPGVSGGRDASLLVILNLSGYPAPCLQGPPALSVLPGEDAAGDPTLAPWLNSTITWKRILLTHRQRFT